MGPRQPIACSLDAGAAKDRYGEWERLLADGLLGRQDVPGGVLLALDPGVLARARTLVEAERACCAFLDLRLRDDVVPASLRITGPPETLPVIALLAGSAGA